MEFVNELVHDLVIVGGGVAGMSAARLLARKKVFKSILVLESQDRIGGRTFSVPSEAADTADINVDIGGQWVGPTHTRALSTIQEYGLQVEEQVFSPPDVFSRGHQQSRAIEMYNVKLEPLTDEEEAEMLAFENFVEDLAQRMDISAPWTFPDAEYYDSMTIQDYIDKYIKHEVVKYEIHIFINAVLACDPDVVSFFFFAYYVASGGGWKTLSDGDHGAQKYKVKGGMQQLAKNIGAEAVNLGVSILFNTYVKSVSKDSNDNFNIVCHNGQVVKSKRTLFAMCPGQAMRSISFADGLLSEGKKSLYSSFVEGKAVKLIISFRKAPWDREPDAPLPKPTEVKKVTTEYLVATCFHSQVGNYPTIVALVTGRAADKYCAMTPDERRENILNQVAEMYGCSKEVAYDVAAYTEKNWCEVDFSIGCFAGVFPCKALTSFGPNLRSFENNMFWAGTETSPDFYGYVEGGIRSGERAANQILSTL